jgi:serine/threonine protein kinase
VYSTGAEPAGDSPGAGPTSRQRGSGVYMTPGSFGPYQLTDLIGRGGMGEVYRAFDTRRQRTVALKRLRPQFVADEKFRGRFIKECRRAARLTQAHVIPIHDFGEIDGRLYLDMRLIEGDNVAEALAAAGHFLPDHAVEVVWQIAGALDAAHAAGIVHRDVKPSNVLIGTDEPTLHCYLADFGVAGAIGDTGGASGTATGGMLGTYDYIAPERLLGRPSDHRVDVYALACMLYELLIGAPPFRRDEVPAMIHAHLNVEPPRASDLVAGIPPMLDAVIARGMAKDPRARFSSAGELAAAAQTAVLGARVTSPVEARQTTYPGTSSLRSDYADLDTARARPQRRTRRRIGRLLIGTISALFIAGTSTAATWYLLEPVVQLEAANSVGAEPPFVPEEVSPPAQPPSTQAVVPTAVSVVSGDTPGLYGGTMTNECNVAGIERYLDAHPDRRSAWARAQSIDPGKIHSVLASLTPVTLRTDTAVTNHGFKNGNPTQFQSVLQAGTAVLIDIRGVPRVRCYCGNPLQRPEQPSSVRYEGPTWTDFSTRSVTVINSAAAPVVEFVVVERETNKVVSRPRATSGERDHDADPVTAERVRDRRIGESTPSHNATGTEGDHDSNGDASTPSGGASAPSTPSGGASAPSTPSGGASAPSTPSGGASAPPTSDAPPASPDAPPASPDAPPASPNAPPAPPDAPPAPPAPPAGSAGSAGSAADDRPDDPPASQGGSSQGGSSQGGSSQGGSSQGGSSQGGSDHSDSGSGNNSQSDRDGSSSDR